MANYKMSFRKWGNGSSSYTVSFVADYNPITQQELFECVGNVEKISNNLWLGTIGKEKFYGETRKEVSTKLVNFFRKDEIQAEREAEAEAIKASLAEALVAPIGEVKEEVAIEEEVVVEGEVAGTIKPIDGGYQIKMYNGWLMIAGSKEEAIEKCQEEFKLNKQAEAEPTIAEFKELKPLSQEEFENTPIQQARKLIETEEVFSVKVSQTLNLSCYDDDEWDYTGMHGVMIYVEVLRPCNFTNEPRRTFITWSINLEGKSIDLVDMVGLAIFEEMKRYYPNTTFRKTVNDPQNEE